MTGSDHVEWTVVVGFTNGEIISIPCESEDEATNAVQEIYEGMGVDGAKVIISDHAAVLTSHVRFAFLHDDEPIEVNE